MYLIKQPEIDSHKISIIGHSEGTTIVPRIAINNSDKVDNIVLMGTLAQNLKEIGKHQIMIPALYAQEVLDHDHDGLISLQEASEDPFSYLLLETLLYFFHKTIPTVMQHPIEMIPNTM